MVGAAADLQAEDKNSFIISSNAFLDKCRRKNIVIIDRLIGSYPINTFYNGQFLFDNITFGDNLIMDN